MPHITLVQALLASLGSIASIAGVVVTIVVTVGPLSPGGGSGSNGERSPGPTQTPSLETSATDVASLPAGSPDFALSPVDYCQIDAPDSEDAAASLFFGFDVINNGGFEFDGVLFNFDIESDLGGKWKNSITIDSGTGWELNRAKQQWLTSRGVYFDLTADQLGKRHEFTIHVDPTNLVAELDEDNNETSVLVDVPVPDSDPPEEEEIHCR